MAEQNVFSFDKEVYKRNKKRRFWRILLFLWFIYLMAFLLVAFLKLLFEDSSYIAEIYIIVNSPFFGISFLLTPIIFYFVNPGPIQTITIASDSIQIEQNHNTYEINKSSISAIEEFEDAVIVKIGKQKFRLSRDLNDFKELLNRLTEIKTVDKYNIRPYLFASGLAVILFGYLFGTIYLIQTHRYALFWIFEFTSLVMLGIVAFRYWKNPPFKNSDQQTINKQIKLILVFMAIVIAIILLLGLYAYYLFYIRLPNLLS